MSRFKPTDQASADHEAKERVAQLLVQPAHLMRLSNNSQFSLARSLSVTRSGVSVRSFQVYDDSIAVALDDTLQIKLETFLVKSLRIENTFGRLQSATSYTMRSGRSPKSKATQAIFADLARDIRANPDFFKVTWA
jgi:hypothetical protein